MMFVVRSSGSYTNNVFLNIFSGLGGLGPEYLLHAAGPASTLASSEFPFSIDGKIYSNI